MVKYLFIFCLLFSHIVFASEQNKEKVIPLVKTTPLSDLLLTKKYFAPAQIVSIDSTQLRAEINARVIQVHHQKLERVKHGELLIELDCTSYQLLLKQKQIQLKLAQEQLKFDQSQLNRAIKLKRDKNISQELMDQRRTDVKQKQLSIQIQKTAIQLEQNNVKHCKIYAPYDAYISKKNSSVGDFASPSSVLLELVQINPSELSAFISQKQLVNNPIKQTTTQTIYFSLSDQTYPVRLLRSSPAINVMNKTQEYRFSFIETDPALIIGQTGRLIWEDNRQWISSKYLSSRNDTLGVFSLNQDKNVQFHPLKQATLGQMIELKLPLETPIITLGYQSLQPGERVKVSQKPLQSNN